MRRISAGDLGAYMMMQLISGAFRAVVAGALGGAFVGVLESSLITTTSATPEEYWLFFFGVVSYGLLGALVGGGAGMAWGLVWRRGTTVARVGDVAMIVGLGLPGFAVARYHVVQRVFHEDLVMASGIGVVTHVGLVIGALAAGVVGVGLLRLCARFGAGIGPLSALGVLVVFAFLIGRLTGMPVETRREPQAAAPGAAGKPNIVLIIIDTLRADAVEPFGAPVGATPAFARLAAESVTFSNAVAQSSWTRPSVATILSSEYPAVHRTVQKMDVLPDRVFTLAEALRAEGYWTAGFVNNINVAPVFNFQQGFDEYVYLAPSFHFWATDSGTRLAIYKGLRVARERLSRAIYFEHFYQDAAVLNARVATWLEQRPPQPFFLLMHYMDPHDPYFEHPYNGRGVARVMDPNPRREMAGEMRGLYAGEAKYADRYLGEFLDRMRLLGLYDGSVISVIADHGEEFQDHGGWWHGTTLYEEAVRVPLFIKRAGPPSGGEQRTDPARTLDVAPTLMAAAGLRRPSSFMGVDLFSERVNEPLFAEEDLEGNLLASIRDGDWKLITANRGNPRGLAPVELFDLARDPREKNNLAAQEGARVNGLLGQLDRMRASIKGRAAVGGRGGG